MKKVVCIYDYNAYHITVGKCYTVIGESYYHIESEYKIINDIGEEGFYSISRFKPLDEIRQEKIKELGI